MPGVLIFLPKKLGYDKEKRQTDPYGKEKRYRQKWYRMISLVSISSTCSKDQFAVFTYYFQIFTDPPERKTRHSSFIGWLRI